MHMLHDGGISATAPGLPMARLDQRPAASPSHYVVTAVDIRGRLADRSGLHALAWAPGHRIAIKATAEMAIVTGRADGPTAISALRLYGAKTHRTWCELLFRDPDAGWRACSFGCCT
jgi:hypothetical protein